MIRPRSINRVVENEDGLVLSDSLNENIIDHYWYNARQQNLIITDDDAIKKHFTKRLIARLLYHGRKMDYNFLTKPIMEIGHTIFIGMEDYNDICDYMLPDGVYDNNGVLNAYDVNIKGGYLIDEMNKIYDGDYPTGKERLCLYVNKNRSLFGAF